MRKVLNNTSVDEKALHLNLFREIDEDIDSFSERVNQAYEKAFELTKDSFFESLDYLTSKRSKLLFEIMPKEDYKLWHLEYDGVFLHSYNHLNVKQSSIEVLNNFKFSIDFIEEFKRVFGNQFEVTYTIENDFDKKYLLSENIIPFNNYKHRFKFLTKESSSNVLNDKYVVEIADANNNFNASVLANFNTNNISLSYTEALETVSNASNEYYSKSQVFLKKYVDEEEVFYNYIEWPLRIYWNEAKAFEFNSDSFDYRIKDKVKINSSDTEDKPYLLNQKGAKLINQLLKLDNTYWGK